MVVQGGTPIPPARWRSPRAALTVMALLPGAGGGPPAPLMDSCEPTPTSVVIDGELYTSPQSFADLDSLTIRNTAFIGITGAALSVSRVGTVLIEDCTFTDITSTSSGIAAISGRSNGSVTIQDVQMQGLIGHGIKFPDSADDVAAHRSGTLTIERVHITDVQRIDGVEGTANGIQLAAADQATVRDSIIEQVGDWGLKLGYDDEDTWLRLGEVGGVLIDGNQIHDVMGDGVLVLEGAYNVTLTHNSIWDIATDRVGARPNNGDHGIYFQSNVSGVIADNHIWNNFDSVGGDPSQPNGVGISYRSGDLLIARNHVHDISRNGIAYYSDHPGSGTVRVESNLVYRTGMGGIYLGGALGPSTNPTRMEVDRHEIFNNTVYMSSTLGAWSNHAPLGWYLLSEPCSVYAWGNLLALDNGDPDPNHYILNGDSAPTTAVPLNEWPGQEGQVFLDQNLKTPYTSPLEQVFTDPGAADLTLAPGSPAIDAAPLLDGLVLTDVSGVSRRPPNDIGAWEFTGE